MRARRSLWRRGLLERCKGRRGAEFKRRSGMHRRMRAGGGKGVHHPRQVKTLRFMQVNVFSAGPLDGNPLAVVHAAQELSEARMAQLAH